MEPQQIPGSTGPAEASVEPEQRESSSSSEQSANAASPEAQQPVILSVDTARGPSQRAVLIESPRLAHSPRQVSDQPSGYTERPAFENMGPAPTLHWVEGSRYPMLRAPTSAERIHGRPRTAESMRRSTYGDPRYSGIPLETNIPRLTVLTRLGPMLKQAREERIKCNARAKLAKWGINIISLIQVFLGAMTTGVSAIRLDGNRLGIATTVLGILTTLAGAFVAKVRAEGEPEQSLILAHTLTLFIRKCEDFITDYGDEDGTAERHDARIKELRHEHETLMKAKKSDTGDTTTARDKQEIEKENEKQKDREKSAGLSLV